MATLPLLERADLQEQVAVSYLAGALHLTEQRAREVARELDAERNLRPIIIWNGQGPLPGYAWPCKES